MNKFLTIEEGTLLVHFARQTIENYVRSKTSPELPKTTSKTLQEHRSVFVTIKKINPLDKTRLDLRGCIGRLQSGTQAKDSQVSLLEATRQAAISAAMDDPRFAPLKPIELDSILIEVSVLTVPEEIHVTERTALPAQLTIGKDGIIVEFNALRKGLLLPQVAPEQGWNSTEFLQGCCQKAGLPPNAYLDSRVKIYRFQAQIYAETSVRGIVEERKF